jgi:hypothetical protein
MQWPISCQGRLVGEEEVRWLRGWIEKNPQWSRRRLAGELCREWNWCDGRGRLKDFAARSFFMKLAERGLISLPEIRTKHRSTRRRIEAGADEPSPPPVCASLVELEPVGLEVIVAGTPAARRWGFYLERHHYLGLRIVGENLGYLATDRFGRDVAALLFGAPAWRCASRDQYLGWSEAERTAGLGRLANNTRFLILPHVRVPHLASHLLGAAARRINADWQAKYAHGLDWLETFVENGRFRGTCYRAANWLRVGDTRGRGRQDRNHTLRVPPKAVYLYRLTQ